MGKFIKQPNVPLSPLDQEATKATFNKLISNLQYRHHIPALLASFRVEGLRVFMNGISGNFGATPIYFTLATISVPFIDDESGIECVPFNLAAKHFGQVLKLSEEILGPNEVTTLTDDEAPLFTLGAIRHFLHVDAQQKPKSKVPLHVILCLLEHHFHLLLLLLLQLQLTHSLQYRILSSLQHQIVQILIFEMSIY